MKATMLLVSLVILAAAEVRLEQVTRRRYLAKRQPQGWSESELRYLNQRRQRVLSESEFYAYRTSVWWTIAQRTAWTLWGLAAYQTAGEWFD